jgi:hypothetical protein
MRPYFVHKNPLSARPLIFVTLYFGGTLRMSKESDPGPLTGRSNAIPGVSVVPSEHASLAVEVDHTDALAPVSQGPNNDFPETGCPVSGAKQNPSPIAEIDVDQIDALLAQGPSDSSSESDRLAAIAVEEGLRPDTEFDQLTDASASPNSEVDCLQLIPEAEQTTLLDPAVDQLQVPAASPDLCEADRLLPTVEQRTSRDDEIEEANPLPYLNNGPSEADCLLSTDEQSATLHDAEVDPEVCPPVPQRLSLTGFRSSTLPEFRKANHM